VVGQRQRFKINNVNGSIDHWLGPLDRISLSVFQSLTDYSEESQLDHNFLGANISYDHTLSERTTVGTRISWGRQVTDRLEVSDDVTDYYNLSGFLSYSLSPTIQLSLSAGPALIQGNSDDFEPRRSCRGPVPLRQESDGYHFLDATTCPQASPGVYVAGSKCKSVAPALTNNQLAVLNFFTNGNQTLVPFAGASPSVDDSNTTYFASATLSKQWERWSGGVSYTRSAGQSTAVASVSESCPGT
jgi:hypothetical protein